MRAWTLGYGANPAAFEYEAEFISNPVTNNSTMEAEPLTAAHKEARIGSKDLWSKAWL